MRISIFFTNIINHMISFAGIHKTGCCQAATPLYGFSMLAVKYSTVSAG